MAPPPFFLAGKDLPILWEDKYFIVINKPAGLAVHPGPHTRDSVETRLTPQKRGGPWLVHRLDADTAGCLLIARRKTALIAAQNAFADRRTLKRYWALVIGKPPQKEGRLESMVQRVSTAQGGWRMVSDHGAQPSPTAPKQRSKAQHAATSWRLLATNEHYSLLELTLHTGRTHQARLHCAELGTPILGDALYGGAAAHSSPKGLPNKFSSGLCLLARSLDVPISLPAAASPTQPAHTEKHHIQAIAENERMNQLIQHLFGTLSL